MWINTSPFFVLPFQLTTSWWSGRGLVTPSSGNSRRSLLSLRIWARALSQNVLNIICPIWWDNFSLSHFALFLLLLCRRFSPSPFDRHPHVSQSRPSFSRKKSWFCSTANESDKFSSNYTRTKLSRRITVVWRLRWQLSVPAVVEQVNPSRLSRKDPNPFLLACFIWVFFKLIWYLGCLLMWQYFVNMTPFYNWCIGFSGWILITVAVRWCWIYILCTRVATNEDACGNHILNLVRHSEQFQCFGDLF